MDLKNKTYNLEQLYHLYLLSKILPLLFFFIILQIMETIKYNNLVIILISYFNFNILLIKKIACVALADRVNERRLRSHFKVTWSARATRAIIFYHYSNTIYCKKKKNGKLSSTRMRQSNAQYCTRWAAVHSF